MSRIYIAGWKHAFPGYEAVSRERGLDAAADQKLNTLASAARSIK